MKLDTGPSATGRVGPRQRERELGHALPPLGGHQLRHVDRALVPQAVEEGLRWDGPVVSAACLTTADCEIQGVKVPGGALLDMMYGSANHDPAVFDHPHDFDVFRERHWHFGFAFGAHNCLGQQLARLETGRAPRRGAGRAAERSPGSRFPHLQLTPVRLRTR